MLGFSFPSARGQGNMLIGGMKRGNALSSGDGLRIYGDIDGDMDGRLLDGDNDGERLKLGDGDSLLDNEDDDGDDPKDGEEARLGEGDKLRLSDTERLGDLDDGALEPEASGDNMALTEDLGAAFETEETSKLVMSCSPSLAFLNTSRTFRCSSASAIFPCLRKASLLDFMDSISSPPDDTMSPMSFIL